MTAPTDNTYLTRFRGSFKGVLRWAQLDDLWEVVRHDDKAWYVYAVGEAVPTSPSSREDFVRFLKEVDELLHRDHEEDYCGIVYTDDFSDPHFIKIFDPHNLGVSCGYSDNPPLPGWVLSTIPPADLPHAFPPPANRKRWWQKLFS